MGEAHYQGLHNEPHSGRGERAFVSKSRNMFVYFLSSCIYCGQEEIESFVAGFFIRNIIVV